MKNNYIVLLQKKYLLFFVAKPKKRGSFLHDAGLFEMAETVTSKDILAWKSKYVSTVITEVTDWE